MVDVNALFAEFAALPQVESIALGGSRACERNDEKSDYDVYVYLNGEVPEKQRIGILSKYCSRMEINNRFWETEDDVTLNDGIDMDIIYRRLGDFEQDIASVVTEFRPRNGYTTCMWHNLIHSKIIADKHGLFQALQEKYRIPYPPTLKKNIVKNNMALLSGNLPSYDGQIKKAEDRGDLVSVNHRVAEFLASYFDILFALNEMTHPGEKRMQSICAQECRYLPNDFDENLNDLFKGMFVGNAAKTISRIVEELKKLLNNLGWENREYPR